MTLRKILSKVIAMITPENLGYAMDTFNKGVQDFGKSMDSITKEFSGDVSKSNKKASDRRTKDKENLEKIWGKRK